ncbi:three-Cys-motif partner protein TcmP [Oscillibacter valericigenes]|nr:three-Cys-motif partner protein TcmP [Oscillibacter valericigenes]
MSELQQFGGDWTIEKLDILTGYLDAYLTALKNFHFKKIYIDAFAGTGSITTRDGQREIAGSARLALLADNHFDQYYFIEKDKKKAAQLQQMVNVEFPKLSKCVHIKQGDANTELTSICSAIDWRFNRALLFLDPYATEVSWTTLETIAKTESFDVWYLFPFSALNRMLRRDGHMEQSWIDCINRLLGDSNWMDEFYKEDPQIDLFSDNKIIKDASSKDIEQYILRRLWFDYTNPFFPGDNLIHDFQKFFPLGFLLTVAVLDVCKCFLLHCPAPPLF